MMNLSNNYYQTLCPADKREILKNLSGLLSELYKAYGNFSGSKNSVKILIGSKRDVIKKFVELMQSEIYPCEIIEKKEIENVIKPSSSNNLSDVINESMDIPNPTHLFDKTEEHVEEKTNGANNVQSEAHKQKEVFLSPAIKTYIDSVIQNTVSIQLDEKMTPFLKCLNQYEEEIRIYRERVVKLQEEENTSIYSDINRCVMSSSEDNESVVSETRENNRQKEWTQPDYLRKENVKKSENVGMMNSLTDNIQKQIREALNIYNEHNAIDNFVVRRILKKTFDKPIIRLVLPNEDARDFANKPIKDLKNDKTYQTVFLESTDGSSDYIAIPIGENIYAVFPVKFEPYNQNFAWKRAYPLFFEILPNNETEAHSYILKQPAFFQKNGEKYQMLENGKGSIELVP